MELNKNITIVSNQSDKKGQKFFISIILRFAYFYKLAVC
jgi:hypothetical protein